MVSRIVLVGFPGSGKSTTGKKLSKCLNWEFKDIDSEFEKNYKLSIPLFFQKYGEPAFRKCEKQILNNVLTFSNVVISCGGGTPCYENNMALIVQNSLSIYLKMSPKSLYDRLSHSKKNRPLIAGMTERELQQYVDDLLLIREPFYNQAQLHIKGENLKITDLYTEIINN